MFGGSKPFGTTSTPTFGSTTQGSGLFGNNANQNKPMFGSNTTGGSSLFGQKQASTTSLFGNSTPQQSTSLFGASTANNNAGGGGLFGSSAQKSSLFGASTTTQNTNFGGTTGGGLFGSSNQQSGNLFGSSTATNAPNGTTIKFNPHVANDTMMKNGVSQQIQTKNFCISAMKEYEGKSFEELRVDDYIANRKAPAAGSTGGLFGTSTANTSSGGLFGTSTQQQQPKSLFGSTTTTSSPFGGNTATQGTSLFGQNTQQQQQQSTSLFGNKPATGGGLFGSTAPTNTFGASGTTTGGSLFGNTATSTANTFGTTNTNTFGSTFGQATQPAQTGGLFGSTAAPATTFGTNTTTGGLFGNTQQTAQTGGGLFGKTATPTSTFGAFGATTSQPATTTSGGLFGSTPAKTGLFGATTTQPATGGLFGSTPQQATTGGLFGAAQPVQTGGLFGQPAAPAQGTVIVSNPATVEVAAKPIILGSDVNETMLKMAMIEASLATNPYGDSPLLKLASPIDTEDKPNPVSATRQMRFLKKVTETANTSSPASDGAASPASNKISFLSMNVPVAGSKVRSRAIAIGSDLNYKSTRTPPTLGKGIGGKANGSANASLRNTTLNGSLVNRTVDSAIERALNNSTNGLPGSARRSHIKHLDLNEIKSAMKSGGRAPALDMPRDADELPPLEEDETASANDSVHADPREAVFRRQEDQRRPIPRMNLDSTNDSMGSPAAAAPESRSPVRSPAQPAVTEVVEAPAGVSLKTSDYFCEPTIRAMASMVVDGKVVLPDGLTIGRATYGSVFWPGPLELSSIALDEVVIFRHKEVTVYPDESVKPPEGEGLNRPAEVTLERVWHVDRATKQEIKDPIALADMGWRDRLERVTLKMGALFKDYRPSTGSWVFKVEHFSKYGLPDDDDEEEEQLKRARLQKEQRLHSNVQRMNVTLMETEETNAHDVVVLEIQGTPAPKTTTITRRGLGGDEDMSDPEMWEDHQIPPEKKPKMESKDQVVEESRRLMETLLASQLRQRPEKPMLKSSEATRKFTGGMKVAEMKGVDRSMWIDMGCARGRVSRVGWSADGLFVKAMQPKENTVLVRALDREADISPDFISDMMEHNIRLSSTIKRNHSISAKVRHHELEGQQVAPRIKPTGEFAELIDSFCATANQSNRKEDERVWKLCKALFPASREGRWRWERLDRVCEWLREEVGRMPAVDAGKGRGAKVWSALCRGLLGEAIEIAMKEKLLDLCSFLAIFQVDPRATQQDFVAQINAWERARMLEYIDTPLLKIYLLLAGRLAVSFTSKGRPVTVSVIDGLGWKQAMGLHLWYLRGFRCFEEAVDEAFVQVPAPKHADDQLFLHLLKIVRNNAHSVEAVLDAAIDYCPSGYDYLLAWHLWTVLRSIGYNTMLPSSEQRLHSGYAEQLIASDLPHLALVVLSYISNDQSRSSAMRDCLDRVGMIAENAHYRRMTKDVELPKTWIASAKYIKAKAMGQQYNACWNALQAGDLTTAYRIFTTQVAPNAVLSEDLTELRTLIAAFEPVADRIPGWGQQGQMYADYADFKNMSVMESEGDDDQKLSDLLSSMTCKLQAPVFETPLQRLCAQNIGVEMFEVQRLLTGTCNFNLPLDTAHLCMALRRSVKMSSSEA